VVERLVKEAVNPFRSVAKKLVEVAFVITEDVAKIFCEKRLRKRRALVPRDRVISVVGRMSPARLRRDSVVVARVLVPSTLKRPAIVSFVVEALAMTA
jgi:hypothetical protein